MEQEVLVIGKDAYFKNGENIYIHRSDNTGFNGILHKHRFIELICVTSGSAMHQVNETCYPVKKGNVILVDYNTPHSFTVKEEGEEPFETYDLLFTPDFFNVSMLERGEFRTLASSYLFSSLFTEFRSRGAFPNLIKTNSKELKKLFDSIYEEYTRRKKGFMNVCRAHLVELIIKIFREIDRNQPSFTQSHLDIVEAAVSYMQENFTTHISLDDIVENLFLSKNYFRQMFKKTTGISVSSYIQELRIEKACRLLASTKLSSAKIAHECGFNDTKFFYQTFKKALDMTPSEYRRRHAGEEGPQSR